MISGVTYICAFRRSAIDMASLGLASIILVPNPELINFSFA
ncbi:uncharacterized protein METZ01_LOCUS110480 [marine metagenome]|uniref:Uncharacterized protein n=1 Tax=marine metagenome TaxID=408172 RepID=A0A381WYL3_9ZZZZ